SILSPPPRFRSFVVRQALGMETSRNKLSACSAVTFPIAFQASAPRLHGSANARRRRNNRPRARTHTAADLETLVVEAKRRFYALKSRALPETARVTVWLLSNRFLFQHAATNSCVDVRAYSLRAEAIHTFEPT